jgi:hypothetical protein
MIVKANILIDVPANCGWHGQLVARVPKEQKGNSKTSNIRMRIGPFALRALANFASATPERRDLPHCNAAESRWFPWRKGANC